MTMAEEIQAALYAALELATDQAVTVAEAQRYATAVGWLDDYLDAQDNAPEPVLSLDDLPIVDSVTEAQP